MINFETRKFGRFFVCSIRHENTSIDVGFMDLEEAKEFLENLKMIIDDVEWFIQTQEK